ncbi:unnamed protein product [Rotaria sp. Silwood2]|nr:unnamed protein product [Rotaria sp. Silwood2]CAF4183910.1 unnamed protein product [Rotaria sp. Silwood2]
MYTQILKEILLTIDFNEQHIKDFTTYYRENFTDNAVQLNNIGELARGYDNHWPPMVVYSRIMSLLGVQPSFTPNGSIYYYQNGLLHSRSSSSDCTTALKAI